MIGEAGSGQIERVTRPEGPVTEILERHFDLMRATSPEESCHVMAPDSLFASGAVVLVWRDGSRVLGIGALKPIDATHGELKSMHTLAEARGRGIACAILRALVAEARDLGLSRVSLETGSSSEFAAARALYSREGFADCPPFGSYTEDPLSVFMTRTI